jgi:hypothetical protein
MFCLFLFLSSSIRFRLPSLSGVLEVYLPHLVPLPLHHPSVFAGLKSVNTFHRGTRKQFGPALGEALGKPLSLGNERSASVGALFVRLVVLQHGRTCDGFSRSYYSVAALRAAPSERKRLLVRLLLM